MRALGAMVVVFCGMMAVLNSTNAADLPDSTRRQLKAVDLDESFMDGLDRELNMPAAWIAGVKREPPVKILGTWDTAEWKVLSESFIARYPFVQVKYARSARDGREMQSVMAFSEGRYVTDILTSYSSTYAELKKANALADLRELPNFHEEIPGAYDPDGLWVGERISYWCMAYNTESVKKDDLPKDWDDLLTNGFWRNGKFAVSNTPVGWLTSLYAAKGKDWTENFMTRLFVDVKPQRRKEGREASVHLAAAGELAAVAPSSDYRVRQFSERGAPVGFHCPSIVPSSPEWIGILRGSPAQNGAKIFLNWFLSKEGQLGIHVATGSASPHKDFQRPEFLNFPDEILDPGKKIIIDPFDPQAYGDLQKLWTIGWNNQLPGQ
jgi:iron(III) transport system substrate-binding protein